MGNFYTSIGLFIFLIAVVIIGYWSSKKVKTSNDFYLGGDQLPGWGLALSERCSDMSGWLLIGVPGIAWETGLSSIWIIIGAAGGAIFQWIVYSKPFMEGRKETGALTPVGLIAEKLPTNSMWVRLLPGIVTFVFYMGYIGSQFLAGGKVLNQTFGLDTTIGLLIVAIIIIIYSFVGGFMSVVWTDVLQSLLMVFTLTVLPLILLGKVLADPSLSIMASLEAAGPENASWLGGKSGAAAMLLIGANLSWFFANLGGYPHLDSRMMALNSEKDRKQGLVTATVWSILTSFGAIMLGLLARTLHGAPAALVADREMTLPFMVLEHTPAILGGILLAGALAAMMSTADSQLLVASSAAAEDIYTKVFKKEKSIDEKTLLKITRLATIIIGGVGLIFAFTAQDMVYTLVSFSATGLFSAFGPAITLTFFWGDKVSTKGIITAFLVGPLVTILWITLGLNAVVTVRLIAPPLGFISAIVASLIWPRQIDADQKNEKTS